MDDNQLSHCFSVDQLSRVGILFFNSTVKEHMMYPIERFGHHVTGPG